MAGPPPSTTEDICKMGLLVKIKTNKRKYFVLRDETKSSSARLEYYDNEKKWRTGAQPKRTIVLRNCFNINSKPDARHRFAIALYTKDDCFAIACQSEGEQQEWLTSMIDLRSRNIDESTATRPLFEHIWPVTVKSKGLGSEKKVIPGQYRLCLTNKDLSLIRMNKDQTDIVLPLECIRRCGHTNQFFFLELGRSAKTGSGNLWLQVEDMVIAQNIHEALLSSMKSNEGPVPSIFRTRSISSASDRIHNKRLSAAGGGGSGGVSNTNRSKSVIQTGHPSPGPHRDSCSVVLKTSSDGSTALQTVPCFSSASIVGMNSLQDRSIEEEPGKGADDYMTIAPIMGEQPSASHHDSTCSKRVSVDLAKVPCRISETIPVHQAKKSPALTVGSSSSWPNRTSSPEGNDYVPMATPTEGGYMAMSSLRSDELLQSGGPEARGSSSSVSSVMSSVGSTSVIESTERSFHSLSQLSSVADGGYIEMASPPNIVEEHKIRPDTVPSYVRDNVEEFPKRAYSVGSKPGIVPSKPLNSSYIDMSGKSKTKKEAEKSSSAPHLNEDEEKKRELSDLFMELDFNRTKRDVVHRDRSIKDGSQLFRERASSGGSRELRMKAMSFNKKAALIFSGRNKTATAAQHADGRRARTSTICQESLRPRTSSFGPSDLRPRSSSGGNACFIGVASKQLQIGSGQMSQDSLRRPDQRSSQESVESGKSDAYINMNLRKRSTDRLTKMIEGDSGYIDMKPGEDPNSDYMKMTSSAAAATSASEIQVAPSRVTGLGVVMRKKLETVKAGSGEDYLEMTPEGNSSVSMSQPVQRNSILSGQASAPPRVVKSVIEKGSNYMEMTPGAASSDGACATNCIKNAASTASKADDYMEMSISTQSKHGSSTCGSATQPRNNWANTNALSHMIHARNQSCNDKAQTFVGSAGLSPVKDEFKRNATGEAPGAVGLDISCVKADVPPPPFDLDLPPQSFLLYNHDVDEHTSVIPSDLTASRTVQPAFPASSSTGGGRSMNTPDHAQFSYATLDLEGSSVNDGTLAPSEGRQSATGAGRRGGGRASFGPQHIYAQIDFSKSDDNNK